MTVFDDVEVEAAHVDDAEVVDFLVDEVELVVAIGPDDVFLEPLGPVDGPAVEGDQVGGGNPIGGGVEAVEVGEEEAEGVADAAVGVGGALEDFVGDAHFAPVVGGRDPEADDVGAEGLHDVLGPDDVALGFGHFFALGVDGEAVGEDLGVGRPVVDGDAGEQGGLEPAAVLVGAFEVEVRRCAQVCVLFQDAGVGNAGVEPDVQGVRDLLVVCALCLSEQVLGFELEPGVDALLLDALGDLFDEGRGVRMQVAGLFVDQ